jgi:3-oxoacyl-[acyl-carrier protein] reductase
VHPVLAVITGAGSGIGRASALAFAARGYRLALLGRSVAPLDAVVSEVSRSGGTAIAVPCDVSNADDVERAAARVLALEVPHVVVNNAGVVVRARVHEMSEAEWDHVLGVNLKGTFLVSRALLGPMLGEKRGRLVHVGSISSTLGTARQSAYCASKWGVVGFTKALAEELHGTGLQTMCVLPGSVDTPMLQGSGFTAQMSPEDVARLIVYAALDAPPAMNGSAIEMFGP